MEKGTKTFHLETIVYLDPVEAHRVFLKWWWGPGLPVPGLSLLTGKQQDAKDEAGTDAIRIVPGGIHEHIQKAKLGEFIEYTLSRKLFFPASYHRGRISFYQAGPGCTRVTWDINYTPTLLAPLLTPIFLDITLRTMFVYDFTATANAGKSKGSTLGFILKCALFLYVGFLISRLLSLPSKPSYPDKEYLDVLEKHRQETSEINTVVAKNSYLVIGGTGFTGTAIVHDLQKRGARKVRVMARSLPPAVEFPYGPNPSDRYPLPGVEYARGDMTDMKALKEAMKDITVVVQTAVSYGNPSFGSLRGYESAYNINVQGMKNIYTAAKESGTVKQIIYTSSVDVVFTHKPLHYVNETHPYAALGDNESQYASGKWAIGDNYAKTKIQAESFLLSMDNKDGIRTIALRPNGILGPGENVAMKRAVDTAWLIGMIPMYFGESINDWSCVSNLAYAHVLASYKLATDPNSVGGKGYFITDEEKTSLASLSVFKPTIEAVAGPMYKLFYIPPWIITTSGHLLELIDKFAFDTFGIATPIPLNYKEAMKSTMTHYVDNSRAKKDLGYKPFMTTTECVRHATVEIKRRYGIK